MKYLICGLGNPGPEYELTRHNAGFLVLDRLADKNRLTFETARHGLKAELKHKSRKVIMIKPSTYMNLSGKAINYWLEKEKIDRSNLLVVTDDIALPFGKLRMRAKGSSAGHNGMANIEQILAGSNYARLRFGVGNDFSHGQQVDYVLSNFSSEEMEQILPLLDRCCEMILSFVSIGVERTMNFYN